MDYKYSGIILNKRDIGETDRIYTILTLEEGKIRVMGKGARRPNARLAGHLEPITFSEIFVARSRGIGKITGAYAAENFSGIKSDMDALDRVSYAFGILDRIISEQQRDPGIFNLALDYLKTLDRLSLDKSAEKKDILTLGFLFKLMGESGYKIDASRCVSCRKNLKPGSNYFSSAEGGILCENCHKGKSRKIPIKDESIKFIRIFSKNKIENFTKPKASGENARELEAVLDDFYGWLAK